MLMSSVLGPDTEPDIETRVENHPPEHTEEHSDDPDHSSIVFRIAHIE